VSQLSARLDAPVNRSDAPDQIRQARQAAAAMLTGWGFGDPSWLVEAQLVVSERTGDERRPARRRADRTRIDAHDDLVTISAIDGTSTAPRRRTADLHTGFGLAIIEEFADRWGVQPHDSGKRVWARLTAHARSRINQPDRSAPCRSEGFR
jgi:serine/threonine-protein kinase RsbW